MIQVRHRAQCLAHGGNTAPAIGSVIITTVIVINIPVIFGGRARQLRGDS